MLFFYDLSIGIFPIMSKDVKEDKCFYGLW